MATELDYHLEACWDLAQGDRDSYSPKFRKLLDKLFLNRLGRCEGPIGNVEDIKDLVFDLKYFVQLVDDVQYDEPHELGKDI